MKGAALGKSFCQAEAKKKKNTSAKMMWRGSQHWLGVGPDDLLTFYFVVLYPS